MQEPSDLDISLKIEGEAKGKWAYDHKSFPSVKDHGDVDVKIGSAQASVKTSLVKGDDGHPQMKVSPPVPPPPSPGLPF